MDKKFELGTSWRLKDEPEGDAHIVFMEAIGIGAGSKEENELKITFERGDEIVTYPASWAIENMVQV